MEFLLAWGADLNATNQKKMTPLHFAVLNAEYFWTTKIVRSLLLKGARTDIKDNKGLLPIDYLKIYETHIPEKEQLSRELYHLLYDEPD